MRKIWSIPGGIHPQENKSQSLQLPIGELPLPEQMIYPLSQHIGAPAIEIVNVGDRVLRGQKIADAQGMISAPIHASTSGTVIAIEDHTLPHPSGMSGPCLILQPDGLDESVVFEPCDDYFALDKHQILNKIREAGITGMGGAGFPAAVKLNPHANHPIDTLIINGTECEPYITADDVLMQNRPDDIVKGVLLLAHLLGDPESVLIGVEDNKPDAIAALTAATKDTRIEVVSFPTKYPSGGEKQLIQILTGKEVPSGQLPGSIGITLQNIGTTVAIYEAVRFGKPLIERITTVVGEALGTQRNVRVRLGTPINHLLEAHGFLPKDAARLIVGGPMMGFAIENAMVPVIKSTNCVLAPSHQEMPEPPPAQACIRCGMCAEACPASLLPQQLYWYAQAEDSDRLQAHNLMDCIECGACSYVCPSSIPLVQYFRAAKGSIRQQEVEKQKADQSRQRFEFRQQRIAKAEAEKEAKRLARKEAAAAAKKKLAEQKATGTDAKSSKVDVVAKAIASAKTSQVTPQEQLEKAERTLNSANNRLEKLQQKLIDTQADADASPEQCVRVESQIKQAEVKQQDAQKKVAELRAVNTPQTAESVHSNDPVEAAIARAKAKMNMDPVEKLNANVDALNKRLVKAEEKIIAAKNNNPELVEALQTGAAKLKEKLATAKEELAKVTQPSSQPATVPVMDAASRAIEKAKANAAAQASMSDDDKLQAQLKSLEKRLDKARLRLQKAEADNDENVDAFRSGVEKLETKLSEIQQ